MSYPHVRNDVSVSIDVMPGLVHVDVGGDVGSHVAQLLPLDGQDGGAGPDSLGDRSQFALLKHFPEFVREHEQKALKMANAQREVA